jgi:hypothetical protein
MDPNEALRMLLLACLSGVDVLDGRREALEAIEDLRDWLNSGGFLPHGEMVMKQMITDGLVTF